MYLRNKIDSLLHPKTKYKAFFKISNNQHLQWPVVFVFTATIWINFPHICQKSIHLNAFYPQIGLPKHFICIGNLYITILLLCSLLHAVACLQRSASALVLAMQRTACACKGFISCAITATVHDGRRIN